MREKIKVILFITLSTLVVGLIIYNASMPKKPADFSKKAWHEAMTLGKADAENHFIVYTDIFCPYCDDFSRAWAEHESEFKSDYIESGKVYLEYRLTDIISDHSPNAERGGEGGYCAATQGTFWEYYHEMLKKLQEDYHSKGIGVSKTSPKIPELDDDYFVEPARAVAEYATLDVGKFESCMKNHEALPELKQNTTKASAVVNGSVPYFVFNDFVSSGFGGDYATVKMMFKAGGV
ncbi:MAG: DsbA family protein [Candidatus Nomurabacteria bacterium]|nr:DsbA family protein [Candidatus Nomurabacteria bacterium]